MQTGRQDHTCPPAFPYIARILTARVREEGLPAGIAALAVPHAARFRSDAWTWQR